MEKSLVVATTNFIRFGVWALWIFSIITDLSKFIYAIVTLLLETNKCSISPHLLLQCKNLFISLVMWRIYLEVVSLLSMSGQLNETLLTTMVWNRLKRRALGQHHFVLILLVNLKKFKRTWQTYKLVLYAISSYPGGSSIWVDICASRKVAFVVLIQT